MSTRGIKSPIKTVWKTPSHPLIVVADTDGLIAALHQADANFARAKATVTYLLLHEAQMLFPVTMIAEAVTTLKRKLDQPHLAAHIIAQLTRGELAVTETDAALLGSAMTVFNPAGSKRNTLFDALVVATARKYDTTVIFSFDDWYEKLGFTLAPQLAETER